MALPHIKTSDRIRLVYTGDPSIVKPGDKPGSYNWRSATPDDKQKGASVAIIQPLSKTTIAQCAINAHGVEDVMLFEYVSKGFLGFEDDTRDVEEQIENMPNVARMQLGAAVSRVSGEVKDPFGQRSCG